MNFNTANNTFRQLMGNGLLYRVPPFQRDYSWSTDEWDDLWQDIFATNEEEFGHNMGYLVLQSSDSKRFDIIDGQQRITTISIMLLAAISRLHELSFRYNVICGMPGNELERVYNIIAIRLTKGTFTSARAVIAELQPIYPEDKAFKAAFADKALRTSSSRNKKVVRYILFELKRCCSGANQQVNLP
ncbi:MAG: DUF262 domain-containing protein [Candidatus Electrothrix sp. EH2]|nr:DUF262 domain-containing protein [Candidatus Electrothrix sp. EH2]